MYQQLFQTKDGDYDIPTLLIIAANTYSFLTDIIMPDSDENGLEDIMSMQVAGYLATARAAIAQLSLLAAPLLINLQAICHGVSCILCYFALSTDLAYIGRHLSGGW